MSDVEGRDLQSPPHDLQAEEAVIGSILLDPRSIYRVIDDLVPEAFYDVRNRLVFSAAVSLVHQDVPIDYHTLGAELQRQGTYDRSGGLLHLSEINMATPTAAFIEDYAREVADQYVRRRTIATAQTIADHAWRAQQPTGELLAESQTAVLALSDLGGARARSSTAAESLGRWLEGLNTERPTNETGDKIVGCSTGLRCLDKITLGLQPARLYLLAAATAVGKSVVAHQVALHVARRHGAVLLVSLEMSDQELTTRAIAMETGIAEAALATGVLDAHESDRVVEAANRQQAEPLHYLDGSDGVTTSQIRSRAMQLQAQHGRLALIVIDYGQLLQDSKGNNSTVEDQTLVSRNLKRMARALDVPLLVPVQINRQAGYRGDHHPRLPDIRESGSYEQDADVVVGLYRDELVHPDTEARGMLELSVLKNRHSGQRPPFVAKAVWNRGRYWEWDGNSYADVLRTQIPRGVAAAFDGSDSPPSRMPYAESS